MGMRSDLAVIAELIRKWEPTVKYAEFGTGPLSVRFYHVLRVERPSTICIDARHIKAALDRPANKMNANEVNGLTHLADVGSFCKVHAKGIDGLFARTIVAACNRLVRITIGLSNQIRGIMKTFDLVVPAGEGSKFEKNFESHLSIALTIPDCW